MCILLLITEGRLGASRLHTSVLAHCNMSNVLHTSAILVVPSTPNCSTTSAGASRSRVSAGIPVSITPGDSVIPGILPPGGQATYQVPSSACEGDRYCLCGCGLVDSPAVNSGHMRGIQS